MSRSLLLTPVALLDSPYNGTAQAIAVRLDSATHLPELGLGGALNASVGSAIGLFSLNYWSILRWVATWQLSPGASAPCDAAEGALMSPEPQPFPQGSFLQQQTLLAPRSPASVGIPESVRMDGYSSPSFYADVPGGTLSGQGTCYGPGVSLEFAVGTIQLFVPSFPEGGMPLPAEVSVAISYSYFLPPHGTWVYGPSLSAGLAFGYEACP